MPVNLLAVSVGNTHTRFGLFRQGKLGESGLVDHHDPEGAATQLRAVFDQIRDEPGAAVVLATVNRPVSDGLSELLTRRLQARVLWAERDLPIPIGRQLDPEAMTGQDRFLAAAAAFAVLKQACVIVDAGTAITVDFVDGAGTFHGGAIGPGAQMMLDSLHRGTAQLPEVRFAAPEDAIGHNTTQAMRSAVFHGLRGMTRELVERFAETSGSYPIVVATGGDAAQLFEGYDLVDRIVPDLVLMGLAETYRVAVEPSGD